MSNLLCGRMVLGTDDISVRAIERIECWIPGESDTKVFAPNTTMGCLISSTYPQSSNAIRWGGAITSHVPSKIKPDATNTPASEDPELADALMDLYSLKVIAIEEEEVPPDDETIEMVDFLLRRLFRISPRPYYIYSMPDGEIAIDVHTPQDTKLVLICSADGSARCLFYLNDEMCREKYNDLSEIPNRFILDALQKTQS